MAEDKTRSLERKNGNKKYRPQMHVIWFADVPFLFSFCIYDSSDRKNNNTTENKMNDCQHGKSHAQRKKKTYAAC